MRFPRPSRRSIALLVAIVVGSAACGDGGSSGNDAGDTLPALTLTLLPADDGATIDLATPTETPRVINLWATWCAPCRRELPAFDAVAAEVGDDVAFLGINVAEDADRATALLTELGITFPQAVDPDGDVNAELGIGGLPATLFVATDGEILSLHSGALTDRQLRDRLDDEFGVVVGS